MESFRSGVCGDTRDGGKGREEKLKRLGGRTGAEGPEHSADVRRHTPLTCRFDLITESQDAA